MPKAKTTASFRKALLNCYGGKQAFDDAFHVLFAA